MKKIKLDTGVEAVAIGGGVLRFNPGDPNLYVRFQQAADKLAAVETDLVMQAQGHDGTEQRVTALLQEADSRMKQILAWVFGPGNDFDAIVGGVNLLAVAANGERVVTNLFAALEPILLDGARRCARNAAGK